MISGALPTDQNFSIKHENVCPELSNPLIYIFKLKKAALVLLKTVHCEEYKNTNYFHETQARDTIC